MSAWKELPRPATPGPWVCVPRASQPLPSRLMGGGRGGGEMDLFGALDAPDADVIAIAALPDYVAEVDRLRAWVDHWMETGASSHQIRMDFEDHVRAGEWPPGVKP